MANKTSVQLYYDYREQFELLNDGQMRKVVYAMIEYDEHEIIPKLDKVSTMAFSFIKKRIDYDKSKYNDKCLKNKENIKKYWNAKKNDYIRMNTNEYECIRTDTKNTDIELDIDIELDKELDIDINNKDNNKKKSERENKEIGGNCVAPTHTLSSIIAYGKELGADEEYCKKFFNHYESIGWVNGNGLEIKNWKNVFNNWFNKDKDKMIVNKKEDNISSVTGSRRLE